MKTRGFTLIELLAVIVILAIIALIATPIILGIIDNAKNGANRASINGVIRAANNYYSKSLLNNNKEQFNGTLNLLNKLELENAPDKGAVYIDSKGDVALAIVYGKVCYTKYFDSDIYESGDISNCGINNEFTTPSSYVNFGGNYDDKFVDVIETSDGGYLAIGSSNSTKYSHGEDINYDAIIVKYNSKGEVEWSDNFGGTGHDYFQSIIEDGDYYIVGGRSTSMDYDLKDVEYDSSIFIVKYSKSGNIIKKSILYEKVGQNSNISSIIKYNGYYYLSLTGKNINTGANLSFVGKYDENFNQIWLNLYSDSYASITYKMILTSSNTLILLSDAMKNSGQIKEMGIHIDDAYKYTTIFEISANDGAILGATSIGGNDTTLASDIIEISDGYIVVGSSKSNSNYFLNSNKGEGDAYIAKVNKTAVDGTFPVEWVKTFGGSLNDSFSSIIEDNGEIIVAGGSSSSDYDMNGVSISNEGYTNAIIVKYDLDGNLIKVKSYGGSNSDSFNKIIKSKNNYILVGASFSIDKDMFLYNNGQSDAIMMKINDNLDLVYDLNITPILMPSVPELIINYGESIPQPEDRDSLQLYTSIDPTKEIKNWCTSNNISDPNSNYNYMCCLYPFNKSDSKILYKGAINIENTVNVNSNKNDWIHIYIYNGNSSGPHQITNFKVKFEGKESTTIEEAVNLGYIEPLVLSGNETTGNYYYENSFNIIKGENSGFGRYPNLHILIKPKNIKLEQIVFSSDKTANYGDAFFQVEQFHNFDISLTPSK